MADDFTELRALVDRAAEAVAEMRRKGSDPGDIAEAEHHAKQARKHLRMAEQMANRMAKYTEHND
jgi:hypothetical protein